MLRWSTKRFFSPPIKSAKSTRLPRVASVASFTTHIPTALSRSNLLKTMAALSGFDIGFCGIASNPAAAFGSSMDGDEYVRCTSCGFGGCDLRVSGCGCTLHARCLALNNDGPLVHCPHCSKPTTGLVLFPMSFREIDEAQRSAAAAPAKNRSRKRKASSELEDKTSYISERRTGRWTNEEMAYCDKVMDKFSVGDIPVADGVKLNEFLGNMLKSKQSRLTKKMKNAKLSTKMFQRGTGYLNPHDAREFSELEESFFQAVQDPRERAEIKFHMQKEWREQFSRVCSVIGQPLDADAWLNSVEEMERRASQAKDAARMAKRKLMMGVALRADSRNPEQGVFIERSESEVQAATSDGDGDPRDMEEELLSMLAEDKNIQLSIDINGKSSLLHSAPFLAKATNYMQRHEIPFEHIDLWVPSFVPGEGGADQTSCRLCYAGSATVDKLVVEDGKTSRDLSQDEQFNLFAFGDYSQKFSFDVGCGLPGRVYESGRPTWEQSVHRAPHTHFERCGGANQWGIKTVLGIPIASPNVGRIVVTLYSLYDRNKDEDLVARLSEECTRLMPSPKWKLVVDIGDVEDSSAMPAGIAANSAVASLDALDPHEEESAEMPLLPSVTEQTVVSEQNATASVTDERDIRTHEVIGLLGEFMPSEHNPYLQGFVSLRLLLLRQPSNSKDHENIKVMLDSYSSYMSGGRDRGEIAMLLARDFMFMNHPGEQHQQQQASFLGLGQMSASEPGSSNAGLSLFGLPSTSSSLQNSPALTPIPAPGSIDAMSIVSN